MLDPAGLGHRRFGGFGVAIEAPRVVVAVGWAETESSNAVSGSFHEVCQAASRMAFSV